VVSRIQEPRVPEGSFDEPAQCDTAGGGGPGPADLRLQRRTNPSANLGRIWRRAECGGQPVHPPRRDDHLRQQHHYRELKTGLGLDHFEGRSFTGWHRHITLAVLAQAFCTMLRTDPKAPAPG